MRKLSIRALIGLLISLTSLPSSFFFGPSLHTFADDTVHAAAVVNVGNINLGNLVEGTIHNNTTNVNSTYSYGVINACPSVLTAIAAANSARTQAGLSQFPGQVGITPVPGGFTYAAPVVGGSLPTCLQLLTANISGTPAWVSYAGEVAGSGALPTFQTPTSVNGYDGFIVHKAYDTTPGASVLSNTLTPRGTQSYPISADNGSGTTYIGTGIVNVYDAAVTDAIGADVTPPAAPTSTSATDAASGGRINLAWTNPTDGDFAKINIYRSTSAGVTGSLLQTINSTSTVSYADTGLTNGTTYYYTIRSVDATGNISTNTGQVSAAPSSGAPTTGTFAGHIAGPHGESGAVSYTLTNNSTHTSTTGTTGSDGSFSLTLTAGSTYSLAVTPDTTKNGYTYAGGLTLPYIGVAAGQTVDAGTISLHNKAGEVDSDVASHAVSAPSQCSAVPAAGAPVINRADYVDQRKGTFLYHGNSANVIVTADKPGYSVTVDYSILEGHFTGTDVVVAADNGNGTYTATHALANTQSGGGLAIVSATNGSSQTTTGCTPSGPVNLDIRNFFTGSSTSNFPALAADPATDFRALTNFTMHQDGVVKVTFPNPVNMLDPTVQQFMQAIAQKMVAKKGDLSLDAKAAVEIQKTGAVITMYGLPHYSSAPTILVNGQVADSSTVSGITYDSSANSLTFAAAHFSEYQAVPTITVTAPTDGSSTTDSAVTVSGSVNDPSATVKISVGGTDQGTISVGSNGSFSKSVSLTSGSNAIVVTATNSVGSAPAVSRTVTRTAAATSSTSSTTSSTASTSSASSTAALLPKAGADPLATSLLVGLLAAVLMGMLRFRFEHRRWLARPFVV